MRIVDDLAGDPLGFTGGHAHGLPGPTHLSLGDGPRLAPLEDKGLDQILLNLTDNALKHAPPGSRVLIRAERRKTGLLIEVVDSGPGIPPEHRERLFERFYRVDKSGSRKEGGSGLGLSIVKHIIEAHGEKIYVESAVDVGSEFSFTLEKAKEPPA